MSKDIEVNGRAVAVREQGGAVATELSAQDIGNRLKKIIEVQKDHMAEGTDYGTIPGTEQVVDGVKKKRPTLLKPGAEKLCVLFRLDAQFIGDGNREVEAGIHLTVYRYCTIYSQVSGERLGGASAMCSSKESKYRWRRASRKCPECGAEAIMKSRYADRETGDFGWYCFDKKGGCKANFHSTDSRITDQTEGRVENEDIADQFNTIIRMAEKRALIAAVRLVTGASAIFDEEMPDGDEGERKDTGATATGSQPDASKDAGAGSGADTGKKTRGRAPRQKSGNGAPAASGDVVGEAEIKVLEGLFDQVKFDKPENRTWYRATICKQFGLPAQPPEGHQGEWQPEFTGMKKAQFEIACKILKNKIGQAQGAEA